MQIAAQTQSQASQQGVAVQRCSQSLARARALPAGRSRQQHHRTASCWSLAWTTAAAAVVVAAAAAADAEVLVEAAIRQVAHQVLSEVATVEPVVHSTEAVTHSAHHL